MQCKTEERANDAADLYAQYSVIDAASLVPRYALLSLAPKSAPNAGAFHGMWLDMTGQPFIASPFYIRPWWMSADDLGLENGAPHGPTLTIQRID